MPAAKQNACEILLSEIGCAAPAVWQVICKFDAAPWYEQSVCRGKTVVASSRELDAEFEPCLAATVTPVDFTPPGMPTDAEKRALTDRTEFRDRVPPGWWDFPQEMGEAIVAGLRKMFGSTVTGFDELHRTWTAAHAINNNRGQFLG